MVRSFIEKRLGILAAAPPPLILIKIYVNHNSFYDNLASQLSDREKIVFIDFV